MKKIETLTDDQVAGMEKIKMEWIGIAKSGKFDEPGATEFIRTLYSWFQPESPIILFFDSPIQARISVLYLKAMEKISGGQVWGQVWAINPSACINYSDFGWMSFYDYFRKYVQIEFTETLWAKFDAIAAGIKAGIYEIYPYKNVCICVRPPKKIHWDEIGRIHNPQGAAIEFGDGFSVYAIHGRRLPAWIWEQRDTIGREQFLKEKNAEIRGGMYAVLGQKRVFDLIGAEEIAREYANKETYILYRTKEKIGGKYWQWVGVKCPSTGTDYLLGVPHTVTCPIEAVASTWGLTKEDYIINQHT